MDQPTPEVRFLATSQGISPKIATDWPPRSWWSVRELLRQPDVICRRLYQSHSALLQLRLGFANGLLVADPATIRTILLDDDTYSHDTWDYRLLRPFIGQGLLTATGENWRMRRPLVAPAVMSQAARYLVPACEVASQRLRNQLQVATEHRSPVDLHQWLLEFTLSAVSLMTFSRDLSDPRDEIGQALLQARSQVAGWKVVRVSLPLIARGPRRTWQRLVDLLLSEIRARRSRTHQDLLQRLVDVWPDSAVADRELCDEALTVLLTSQVSPAAVASWGCWLMAQQREVAEQLAQEWQKLSPSTSLSLENLPQLPFMTAVYQETLRLYPAVWAIPRVTTAATSIAGSKISQGTQVIVLPYAVQRDPRYWPDPERFQPERFLTAANPVEGTYLPFGIGARSCVGAAATKLLVLSAWTTLFSEFRLESDTTRPIAPSFAITLQPRNGYWARVIRR